MTALKNYRNTFIHQRNPMIGCIPASIEWLLKYHKIDIGANWDNFQERVDGGKDSSFGAVPNKIEQVYGYSKDNFESQSFQNAQDKCEKIKELIDKNKGCLISKPINSSYHITPAVAYDEHNLTSLNLAEAKVMQEKKIPWSEIIQQHNQKSGGKDILWIK